MLNDMQQFRLAWTLVTLAGYVVGILILLLIATNLAFIMQFPFLIGLSSGALLGATVGLGQWLLLRRRTPVTAAWVGATVVGGMLGMALGLAVEPSNPAPHTVREFSREAAALVIPWHVAWQTAVAGAFFGAGLGLAQWWVLRQYTRAASWWITANAAAWMVGLGVGALLSELITTIGALLLTGIITATITAFVMEQWQWEMRKRTAPIPGRY